MKLLALATIILLTTQLNATVYVEGAVGSQGMSANPLNDKIDQANTTDAVDQKDNFTSTICYNYNFTYMINDFWGAGLRFDGINTGIRTGKFNPSGSMLTWSQELSSKTIYATTGYYLFLDDFLVTFSFGLGYSYSNTFTNEYSESSSSTYPDSKIDYTSKGISFILDTTYSWILFEDLDIFIGLGYRYLSLGEMTASKIEGSTTVSKGDSYRTLENSGAVSFSLTGVYVTMGLRAMF